MAAPTYDPRTPETWHDPYPGYHALRAHDPVCYQPSARLWLVSRHADCRTVLQDDRFSAQQGQRVRVRDDPLPVSMLNTDPPEHTMLRAAVAPAFSRPALRAAQPWITHEIDAALRELRLPLAAGGDVDLAAEFAQPLAARLLGRFLGLADDDLADFARWGPAVSAHLDPFARPDRSSRANVAMTAMIECFEKYRAARLADGRDVFTVLARAHGGGQLSMEQAMSAAVLLVVGGFEPLADMIGNAVAALSATGLLDADWPDAVPVREAREELLRFDPPIQFTARTALADVWLGDRLVPRGHSVIALLGAANRDPARFPDPDRLRLGRCDGPHLSFGAGPHVCLGAPLVRLVCDLLLSATWRRLPLLRPGTTPPVRRPGVVPRGYLSLPVCCRAEPS